MVLPEPFTTASPIIASFDYTDVLEGTGVLKLQGFKSADSTGNHYRLSRETLITTAIETTSATKTFTADQAPVQGLDLDFNLGVFNMPKTIMGTLNICTSLGATRVGAGGSGFNGYAIYKLRKYDGTTETEIGSVQSQNVIIAGEGSARNQVSVVMSLTETHFNVGDILRLTVEAWGTARETAESEGTLTIPHDPANRNGTVITPATTTTTKLDVYTPFRYEI